MLGVNAADAAGKLPPELAGVATQLRNVFAFKELRLIETTLLRARDGSGAEASGIFPEVTSAGPSVYQTKFSKLTLSGDGPNQNVRIDNFKFGGRLPRIVSTKGDVQYLETGVSTDVDLRIGQKVVVGKAAMSNTKESLFIVLSARIVE